MDKFIQDSLNVGELSFRITAERQIHEKNMTIDDESYIVGILRRIGGSYSVESIGAVVNAYEIEFYGYNSVYDEFILSLQNLPEYDDSGNSYYFQQPTFDEFKEKSGSKKFVARISFQTIYIKGSISGEKVKIEIDGVEIPVKNILFRKDKSVVTNVAFGKNHDIRFISEVLTLTLPITANLKIKQLLADVLDDGYNKKYEVRWTMSGVEKITTYVSRGGFLDFENSPQPVAFNIILERALPRKEFAIATFKSEPFWFITESGEVYNESYTEEITTEQEFSDFLDSLEIDTVGYTVRNIYHTDYEWQFVGVFDFVEHYDKLELKLSNEIYSQASFMNYAEQQAVEADGYELVVETSTHKYNLIKNQNFPDFSITPDYTYQKAYGFVDFYELLQNLYNDGFFPNKDEVGTIFMFENDTGDFIEYWYIEVVRADSEFILVGDYQGDSYIQADFTDTAAGAVEYMENNVLISSYIDRDFIELYHETSGNKYVFYVNKKRYWKAKIASDAVVFYGELKEGGQYGNYTTTPAIEYGFSLDREIATRAVGEYVKATPRTAVRGFKAVILSDSEELADDLILGDKGVYKLKFVVAGKEYELEGMIIQSGGVPVSEHADLIIDLTFVEGE